MLRYASYGVPGVFGLVLLLMALTYIERHQAAQPTVFGVRGLPNSDQPDPRAGFFSPRYRAMVEAAKHKDEPPPAVSRILTQLTMLSRGCQGGKLEDCKELGRTFAQHADDREQRDESERWYGYACESGSRIACEKLRLMATDIAQQGADGVVLARGILRRACVRGHHESCLDASERAMAAASAGDHAEANAREATELVIKLCRAPRADLAALCEKSLDATEKKLAKTGFDVGAPARESLIAQVQSTRTELAGKPVWRKPWIEQ